MAATVKEMLAAANQAVPRLAPDQAKQKLAEAGVVVLDVRDGTEVAKSGKIKGAVNISRGMLEFNADPESPYHNKALAKDKTILVYCASGGRSALSGKVLKDMGYGSVFNIGGFKELTDAGAPTETA
jgi:rhodanese-related sulfurtransferase